MSHFRDKLKQERRRSSEVNQTGSDKHLIDFVSCVHNTGLSSFDGRGTKKYEHPLGLYRRAQGYEQGVGAYF